MEVVAGYGKPPWVFKGRALYQLHLVKAKTAQAFIPKDFRLVQAFGYTLGGFFLASYDDSPAGIFDELVVIAGLIWNKPKSCAWASRVLVSSDEACVHGRGAVGLPSYVASFSKTGKALPKQPKSSVNGFPNILGCGFGTNLSVENSIDVRVTETEGPVPMDLCTINLATDLSALKSNKWMGPAIKLSLPSFSGHTKHNPNILRYSCKMDCRVRVVKPANVSGPSSPKPDISGAQCPQHRSLNLVGSVTGEDIEIGRKLSISVMLSQPIFALEFDCMKMEVDAPTIVVSKYSGNTFKVCS